MVLSRSDLYSHEEGQISALVIPQHFHAWQQFSQAALELVSFLHLTLLQTQVARRALTGGHHSERKRFVLTPDLHPKS